MSISILIKFFNLLSFSLALSHLELHCNFSNYMLNFFKHNEKYLIKLEKQNKIFPVTLNELKTYGEALQTHGNIVMAMLDALHLMDLKSIPNDLMTINLYFNNVSGSLMFVARNNVGNYDMNHTNIIKGYKMLHQVMVERLENFINNHCLEVTVEEEFIKCPDYNTPGNYNIKFLRSIAGNLKNRITNSNQNLNDYNEHDVKLKESEVLSVLISSLKSNSYRNFDPKNLFFYDLFSRQDNKQFHMIDINNLVHCIMENGDVIDLLRYTTYKEKCSDSVFSTVFCVFRYILYSFDSTYVLKFQELMLTASFQPLGVLIRSYCLFVKNYITSVKLQAIKLNKLNKKQLITIGESIVNNLNCFLELDLYRGFSLNIITKTYNSLNKLINYYEQTNVHYDQTLDRIPASIRHFLMINKLCHSNSFFKARTVGDGNVYSIYSKIEKYSLKVSEYITRLKNFKNMFDTINNTYYFEYLYIRKYKDFINDYNRKYICNIDKYTDFYKKQKDEVKTTVDQVVNDEFEFDVDDLINDFYFDFDVSQEIQNHQFKQTTNETSKREPVFSPKYMTDYIPYNLL
ncbi:uncharacterized protein LOC126895260 [Daktulosphaira vitifoliae]|uniref:uncharacterized protein LOC126895260 n=1 Tax=Daktulosphaira vitifoliae TaxID=58002 RepID=UPI0021AA2FED|nr:uncharacterized protein LOC126895260 [Daktulosphaira vitifoliae]